MSDTTLSIGIRSDYRRSQKPGIVARLAAAWSAARTRRLLAEMDDRALADIGASRAEAVWEDSRPIWQRIDTLR